MNVIDIIDNNCLYNTNYFFSITEFIKKYNICINQSVLMISVNIRSINANLDELLLFLKNDSYFNIDLIVLTETWHNPENCNYNIPGYNIFYSTKKRNQNDGIIIFAKQHLVIDVHEFDFCEANIIKLSISNYIFPINIICIYRSPSGNINACLTCLEEIIMLDKANHDKIMTY